MWKELTKGLWKENPILVIMLGLCPTLAVSTSGFNALGMSAAFIFVLTCSNLVIASVKKFVPHEIRIPVFIVIISTFVTIADYSLKAFSPVLSRSLGVFVPLIVVNCIVMGRAEAFAGKNTVLASLLDGIGMSCGFTMIITLIGIIREVLGNGTVFGYAVMPKGYQPFLIMILPPGAFLVIGFLMAIHQNSIKR
ncbi:electron transport complex subunit RsxE [Candidatus Desantisbacteria bacterium CG1_02_49_89]|nr:MAG: electron transport complex subunit RsxE [Candidatus Desantisbacteria bacterium CG1_02_49_89]